MLSEVQNESMDDAIAHVLERVTDDSAETDDDISILGLEFQPAPETLPE
jgi:hypothetical protein